MVKAVLADLTLMNPAKHIVLEEAFLEVRVPTLQAPTHVYKLQGQAAEDGTFITEDPLAIPNVEAGEYVYQFDRFDMLPKQRL